MYNVTITTVVNILPTTLLSGFLIEHSSYSSWQYSR